MAQNLHEFNQAQNQIERAAKAEFVRDEAVAFIEMVAAHDHGRAGELAHEWLVDHGMWTGTPPPVPSWSLWIDATTGILHASENNPAWGWQGGLRVIAAPGQQLIHPPVIPEGG
jgi:hypothetical protein